MALDVHRSLETLQLSTPAPHILQITLDRPEARNAMNTQMGLDLLEVFGALLLDPGNLRAVVITGRGDAAFCAGGDLKERRGMTDADWRKQHAVFEQAVYRMGDCPIPVIAAVNGAAFGGGAEIALFSDFIYASDNARFALTEVTLGIMPGCGGTQNLLRAAGTRRAKEVLMTGTPFSAQEALDWGIVNSVHKPDGLLPAAMATAARIAGNAPLSVQRIKRAVDLGANTDLTTGLGIEIEAYNQLVGTEDRLEGVAAFNEKRKAKFIGR